MYIVECIYVKIVAIAVATVVVVFSLSVGLSLDYVTVWITCILCWIYAILIIHICRSFVWISDYRHGE